LSFIGFRVFLGLPHLLFKGNVVCFTKGKEARAVKMITYFHLVPKSRTRSALLPLLITPSWGVNCLTLIVLMWRIG